MLYRRCGLHLHIAIARAQSVEVRLAFDPLLTALTRYVVRAKRFEACASTRQSDKTEAAATLESRFKGGCLRWSHWQVHVVGIGQGRNDHPRWLQSQVPEGAHSLCTASETVVTAGGAVQNTRHLGGTHEQESATMVWATTTHLWTAIPGIIVIANVRLPFSPITSGHHSRGPAPWS